MITRVTNLSLVAYQGFTIDKSLIKKIFSWKEPRKGKSKQFFKDATAKYKFTEKQVQIKEEIQQRYVFSYQYR